jgi:hypothetical protein
MLTTTFIVYVFTRIRDNPRTSLTVTALSLLAVRLVYLTQWLMNIVWLNAAMICLMWKRPALIHTLGILFLVAVGAVSWLAIWKLWVRVLEPLIGRIARRR